MIQEKNPKPPSQEIHDPEKGEDANHMKEVVSIVQSIRKMNKVLENRKNKRLSTKLYKLRELFLFSYKRLEEKNHQQISLNKIKQLVAKNQEGQSINLYLSQIMVNKGKEFTPQVKVRPIRPLPPFNHFPVTNLQMYHLDLIIFLVEIGLSSSEVMITEDKKQLNKIFRKLNDYVVSEFFDVKNEGIRKKLTEYFDMILENSQIHDIPSMQKEEIMSLLFGKFSKNLKNNFLLLEQIHSVKGQNCQSTAALIVNQLKKHMDGIEDKGQLMELKNMYWKSVMKLRLIDSNFYDLGEYFMQKFDNFGVGMFLKKLKRDIGELNKLNKGRCIIEKQSIYNHLSKVARIFIQDQKLLNGLAKEVPSEVVQALKKSDKQGITKLILSANQAGKDWNMIQLLFGNNPSAQDGQKQRSVSKSRKISRKNPQRSVSKNKNKHLNNKSRNSSRVKSPSKILKKSRSTSKSKNRKMNPALLALKQKRLKEIVANKPAIDDQVQIFVKEKVEEGQQYVPQYKNVRKQKKNGNLEKVENLEDFIPKNEEIKEKDDTHDQRNRIKKIKPKKQVYRISGDENQPQKILTNKRISTRNNSIKNGGLRKRLTRRSKADIKASKNNDIDDDNNNNMIPPKYEINDGQSKSINIQEDQYDDNFEESSDQVEEEVEENEIEAFDTKPKTKTKIQDSEDSSIESVSSDSSESSETKKKNSSSITSSHDTNIKSLSKEQIIPKKSNPTKPPKRERVIIKKTNHPQKFNQRIIPKGEKIDKTNANQANFRINKKVKTQKNKLSEKRDKQSLDIKNIDLKKPKLDIVEKNPEKNDQHAPKENSITNINIPSSPQEPPSKAYYLKNVARSTHSERVPLSSRNQHKNKNVRSHRQQKSETINKDISQISGSKDVLSNSHSLKKDKPHQMNLKSNLQKISKMKKVRNLSKDGGLDFNKGNIKNQRNQKGNMKKNSKKNESKGQLINDKNDKIQKKPSTKKIPKFKNDTLHKVIKQDLEVEPVKSVSDNSAPSSKYQEKRQIQKIMKKEKKNLKNWDALFSKKIEFSEVQGEGNEGIVDKESKAPREDLYRGRIEFQKIEENKYFSSQRKRKSIQLKTVEADQRYNSKQIAYKFKDEKPRFLKYTLPIAPLMNQKIHIIEVLPKNRNKLQFKDNFITQPLNQMPMNRRDENKFQTISITESNLTEEDIEDIEVEYNQVDIGDINGLYAEEGRGGGGEAYLEEGGDSIDDFVENDSKLLFSPKKVMKVSQYKLSQEQIEYDNLSETSLQLTETSEHMEPTLLRAEIISQKGTEVGKGSGDSHKGYLYQERLNKISGNYKIKEDELDLADTVADLDDTVQYDEDKFQKVFFKQKEVKEAGTPNSNQNGITSCSNYFNKNIFYSKKKSTPKLITTEKTPSLINRPALDLPSFKAFNINNPINLSSSPNTLYRSSKSNSNPPKKEALSKIREEARLMKISKVLSFSYNSYKQAKQTYSRFISQSNREGETEQFLVRRLRNCIFREKYTLAYSIALDFKDDHLLLILMAQTGPCLSKMDKGTAKDVIVRLSKMILAKKHDKLFFQFLEGFMSKKKQQPKYSNYIPEVRQNEGFRFEEQLIHLQ